MSRVIILIACYGLLWVCPPVVVADPPDHAQAVLRLRGGDFVSGNLVDSGDAETVIWQSPWFDRPFTFPLSAVNTIRFPSLAEVPPARGDFGFELVDGDRLYGSIIGVRGDRWLVETERFGTLALDAAHLRRIFRWRDGGELIYAGPRSLEEWQVDAGDSQWRLHDNVLTTDQPLAQLSSDLQLPAQAHVAVQIAWTERPDFVLALGVDADVPDGTGGSRLEVWGDDLVILQERSQRAAVAAVARLSDGPGRLRLSIRIDQTAGRTMVLSEDGRVLADLHLRPAAGERPRSGVRLQNIRGDVRLESLRIMRGYSLTAVDQDGAEPNLSLVDGSVVRGPVVAYAAASRRFEVRAGGPGDVVAVSADRIAEIAFPAVDPAPAGEPPDGGKPSGTDPPSQVRLALRDGTQLTGAMLQIGRQGLRLKIAELDQPFAVPSAQLRSLTVLPSDAPAGAEVAESRPTPTAAASIGFPPDADHRLARLELPGARLIGTLIESRVFDGQVGAASSPLVWMPQSSLAGAGLRSHVSGQIVFTAAAGRADEQAGGRQRHRQDETPTFTLSGSDALLDDPQILYLRSGDHFPCRVQRITERGIAIHRNQGESTWVEHDAVKAVQLNAPFKSLTLEAARRQRLLTVPRSQRQTPPTHLVASTQGDWLRGRSLGVDDHNVILETPYGTIQVPRSHVAVIVWLSDQPEAADSPDAVDPQPASQAALDTWAAFRVQAVGADGSRLTFIPDELAGGLLRGTSDVLGPCSVALSGLHRLLLGSDAEAASTRLPPPYLQWTLRPFSGTAAPSRIPRVGTITSPGDDPPNSD